MKKVKVNEHGKTMSFEEAKSRYVHRFTMEHIPQWAKGQFSDGTGRYHAPQFRTDWEWYMATSFPPHKGFLNGTHCETGQGTWPLGKWLDKVYEGGR